MFIIISRREVIALLSFVITIPLCIILIIGYVIRNTSDEIADSMLIQYCTDKSSIGATDFYMKDIGNYRFVISTNDSDVARSVELYIFRADEDKADTWTYYGGTLGSESNFNIDLTELEMNHDIKCMFYIAYSDNVDNIARIVINPSDNTSSNVEYNVDPKLPFIIVDDYHSTSPLVCRLFDINGEEIDK